MAVVMVERPSRETPGTYWYHEGVYTRVSQSGDVGTFMACAELMTHLIKQGLCTPRADYGIVACDRNGQWQETPFHILL